MILDQDSYEKFLKVREANKTYPARRMTRDFLVAGLLHCECGRRWQVRVASYTRKNRRGEKAPRKTIFPTYYCPEQHKEHIHSECRRTIGGKMADQRVWEKVCVILNEPEVLIGWARKHIAELQESADTHEAEVERLEKELEAVLTERQWIITQARKGKITEADMDTQLAAISIQEKEIRHTLAASKQASEIVALTDWEDKVREYLADLHAGLESINTPPQGDEEAHEQFLIKRQTVLTLVDHVHITRDRQLKVTFKLDVLAIINQLANFCSTKSVGIYIHTPTSPSPHPRAACASPFPQAHQFQPCRCPRP